MNTEKSQVKSRLQLIATPVVLTVAALLIIVPAGLIWHAQWSIQNGHLTYVGAAIMLQNYNPKAVGDDASNTARLEMDLFLNKEDVTMTPSAAEYLSTHFRRSLIIGARDLTPKVAKGLGQSPCWITLVNLESPSLETLSALAAGSFPVMTLSLPHPTMEEAEILSQFTGDHLMILKVGQLTEESAKAFAQSKSDGLALENLESLSGEAAAALGRFNGNELVLGLNEVTDEAALALRQFPGSLTLTHVKSISESAAKVLSERKRFKCYSGRIRDQAFETLPAATADLLRKP